MANTQAMCTSFMQELMTATHNFTTGTGNTFKAALYYTSATINASTTAYSSTGEVTGTNYTAGGVAVTNGTSPSSTNTSATAGVAYWTPSASFSWSALTVTTAFDAVLVYNSTQSNKAVSVHTFGSQTVTAGNFSLTMPTNDATNALIALHKWLKAVGTQGHGMQPYGIAFLSLEILQRVALAILARATLLPLREIRLKDK